MSTLITKRQLIEPEKRSVVKDVAVLGSETKIRVK